MHIGQYGEKQFIEAVLGQFASTACADSFDDAVAIDLAELTGDRAAGYLVYSMDQPSFVRHADPGLDPFRFYGRWIAGTTCNDIIAMGARCRGFSLALAAPRETRVADLQSLMQGITDVLRVCGAKYEGGNFDSGDLGTVGFAWGLAPRQGIVRRGGARPGDVIAVTGQLGLGWLEYQLRTHDLADEIQPADKQDFLNYKAMPIGAADAVAAAAQRGYLTSGMDLSDGLVEFLYTIKRRSNLGCVIDCAALPVSRATRQNLHLLAGIIDAEAMSVLRRDPNLIALEAGYDSALRHAFTLAPSDVAEATEIFKSRDAELHIIGETTRDTKVRVRREGLDTEIPEFWDDKLRQENILDAWNAFLKELS